MKAVSCVSVILPTYNEAGNIADLATDIHAALAPWKHEVIVVDDNSPDGTWRIIENMTAGNAWLRLERRMKDRGLRKSIWRGIELARGDVVCWMDCDFSMPPSLLPELVRRIEAGVDIAVGSRFLPGGSQKTGSMERESPLAVGLSSALAVLTRWLLHRRFYDWTSGFIAVRRDIVLQIGLRGDYGEYFMDFMLRAILLGLRFVEIPYVCEPRRAGESKTAPDLRTLVRRGVKYLWTLGKLMLVRMRFSVLQPSSSPQ